MASYDGDPFDQRWPCRPFAHETRPCVSGRVSKARPDCCDYSAKLVARSLFAGVFECLSQREALWGSDARKWNRSLPFTEIIGDLAPSLRTDEIDQVHVQGIGLFLDEIVFYHRRSRSLIVADLLFNLSEKDAWITRTMGSLVIGPFPGCRFARLYRPALLDRRRMRTALERILDWDFDQIIVGHGAVVENNGKEVFRTAFRWLLK